MLIVRPKVAELQFSLYERSVHPELFDTYQSRTVERGGYRAQIDITSAGHVVRWTYKDTTLTEVAAAANHPLPERRRVIKHRLHGHRTDQRDCLDGIRYQVSFQLEPVEPSLFWTFQQELAQDGKRKGMLQMFQSSGRMALGALSYINIETRDRSVLTQAFHTFPDDCAIVKVQTLFELP